MERNVIQLLHDASAHELNPNLKRARSGPSWALPVQNRWNRSFHSNSLFLSLETLAIYHPSFPPPLSDGCSWRRNSVGCIRHRHCQLSGQGTKSGQGSGFEFGDFRFWYCLCDVSRVEGGLRGRLRWAAGWAWRDRAARSAIGASSPRFCFPFLDSGSDMPILFCSSLSHLRISFSDKWRISSCLMCSDLSKRNSFVSLK